MCFWPSKKRCTTSVKHAAATEVRISLELQPAGFVLVVADNGRGFDWGSQAGRVSPGVDSLRVGAGNGLLTCKSASRKSGALRMEHRAGRRHPSQTRR